jgi:hypothetical protein
MVYISKSRRQIVVDVKGEISSRKILCRYFQEGKRKISLFTYAFLLKWMIDILNTLGYNVKVTERGFSLIIGLCN